MTMSMTMREVKDMLAKIKEGSFEMVSSIPFEPNHLNVIVSMLAPHFYTQQQLAQLKSFHELETGETSLVTKETTKKRSSCYQTEQMSEGETIKEVKNKKSKKTSVPIAATKPPPELPSKFMERIRELNGSDIKFLMHKKLCNSDVARNNNRLSMPLSKIESEFLNEDEEEKLNERKESKGGLVGVEITLLDPYVREYKMPLKKWEMKGIIYNLVTKWSDVVNDNKFKKDQELDIWCFRVDSKLYFILNNNCECEVVRSQDLECCSSGNGDADHQKDAMDMMHSC